MSTDLLNPSINIDLIDEITGDEQRCQCRYKNNTGAIVQQCDKPAAWLYITRCCGHRSFACEPCHKRNTTKTVIHYCLRCDHQFNTLDEGLTSYHRV